jgi:hypothetical protein
VQVLQFTSSGVWNGSSCSISRGSGYFLPANAGVGLSLTYRIVAQAAVGLSKRPVKATALSGTLSWPCRAL